MNNEEIEVPTLRKVHQEKRTPNYPRKALLSFLVIFIVGGFVGWLLCPGKIYQEEIEPYSKEEFCKKSGRGYDKDKQVCNNITPEGRYTAVSNLICHLSTGKVIRIKEGVSINVIKNESLPNAECMTEEYYNQLVDECATIDGDLDSEGVCQVSEVNPIEPNSGKD